MVSGALLFYNYSEKLTIKGYYVKRFKAIYPMFWLAYISFWLGNVFKNGAFFYKEEKWSYVWSLLGLDGYLADNVTTYYISGEWFLGAIIVLYILFPFILKLFNRNSIIAFVVVTILYVVFLGKPTLSPNPFRSITSCLMSFVLAMVLMKYRKYILNRYVAIASGIICIILANIKFEILSNAGNHVMGAFLFIVMYVFGEWIMKNNVVDKVFAEISRVSYGIYLLQHMAVMKVLTAWNPACPVNIIVVLLFTIILIFCEAEILTLVSKSVVAKVSKIKSKV